MKNIWLLFSILGFLIVTSCEKNRDTAKKEMKLSKLSVSNQDALQFTTYDFDYSVERQIKIKITYPSYSGLYTVYKFDEQDRLSEARLELEGSCLLTAELFTYNSDNTVTCLQIIDAQSNPYPSDSTIYYLGENGFAFKSVNYTNLELVWLPYLTCWYSWQEGELTKIVRDYPTYSDTLEYTYESGLNPLHITDLPIDYLNNFILFCGKHCIAKFKQANNIVIVNQSIDYNKNNYPVNIVKTIDGFSLGLDEYRLEYIDK